MRWSRIRLEAIATQASPDAALTPHYTIDLPLISDGRIALHELAANRARAVVAREGPEGGVVAGAAIVEDQQCIFTWDEAVADRLLPIRLYAESFRLGATIALRPGSGPAQLFEVVECRPIPAAGEPLSA
ncbi:MAG: hypothetical protein ACOVQY_12610 [Erythrobacter sp.]